MATSTLENIVNLDVETLRQAAKDLKETYSELDEWDFDNENDPLRVTLEAYILAVEKLGKFANNVSQEFSLSTALTRDSIVNKAYFAGYIVTNRTAASGQLKITFNQGTSATIDPYEMVVSGIGDNNKTVYYENVNPITVGPAVIELDDVEFIEGRSKQNDKTATGKKYETFLIQDAVIDGTVRLFVNSVEWTEVLKIDSALTDTDQVFVLRRVGFDTYQVTVGNGAYGSIIPEGSFTSVQYRAGVGENGNLASEKIDTVVVRPSTRIIGVQTASASDAFTGGENQEDTEKIRTYAPKVPKLGDRIANTIDMDNYVNSYAGVGRAKSFGIGASSSKVSLITKGGSPSATLVRNLTKDINSRLIFNNYVTLNEAAQVPVAIEVEIIYASNFIKQDIENKIKNNILNFLNPYSKNEFGEYLLEFGTDLLISDVINLAKDVPGVIGVAIVSPLPVTNQVLVQVGDDQILTNTGSTVNVQMVAFEESDIATNKTDKYLFTNPKYFQ